MKNLASLLLISASLTATVALAQDNNGSSLTRAQVATELQAAKAAGQVSSGELDYPPTTYRASTLTRSQVTAELQVAKARGQVSFGELEFPLSTSTASSMSREQVRTPRSPPTKRVPTLSANWTIKPATFRLTRHVAKAHVLLTGPPGLGTADPGERPSAGLGWFDLSAEAWHTRGEARR